MCTVYIDITSENDLYFAISNTVLSMKKQSFTLSNVLEQLKENNITNRKVPVAKNQLKKYVEITIKNLVEHGKLAEEPRWYTLK